MSVSRRRRRLVPESVLADALEPRLHPSAIVQPPQPPAPPSPTPGDELPPPDPEPDPGPFPGDD